MYQTTVNQSVNSTNDNSFSTTIIQGNQPNQGSSLFNFIEPPKTFKNIVIPFVEVINETEFTR